MNVHGHGFLNNSKIHLVSVKNICCIEYKLRYYEECNYCVSKRTSLYMYVTSIEECPYKLQEEHNHLSNVFYSMAKNYGKGDFDKLMAKVE